MSQFFFLCSVMYGVGFALMHAKLFVVWRSYLTDRYRFFNDLFSCPFCVGFHAGWLSSLLLGPYPSSLLGFCSYLLAHGFAGVAIFGILDTLLNWVETRT